MTDTTERQAGETEGEIEHVSAVTELARSLYVEMERLDPSSDARWNDLTDREREFFRLTVEGILARRDLVLQALEGEFASDDKVRRHAP